MHPTYQPCPRCERPCIAIGGGNPEARLLKLAEPGEDGLCPDCAVQAFLMSVETLMYGINKNGVQILLDANVQAAYAQILKVGKSDLKFEQINWQNVVNNWSLDFPTKRKARRKK